MQFNFTNKNFVSVKNSAGTKLGRINLKKGELLTNKVISILRPKIGLDPKMIYKMIGKKAIKDLKKNTAIKSGMFK